MAEITAMRNNAMPYPIYGLPWTVTFTLLDAGGEPITGATCDSEISLNGDTGVDCTNEGTEIPFTTAANKGMYYLTLTTAEMSADVVAIVVASDLSLPTEIVMYPRKLVPLYGDTAQGGGGDYVTLDAAAGTLDQKWAGCLIVVDIDGTIEVRVITEYDGATKQASVVPNWFTANPDADDVFDIYLPEGMARPAADVVAISDGSTAADNLESASDNYSVTRGLTGTALPAVVAGAASGIPLKDASNYLDVANMPAKVAGETDGLFIAGTNAATTITTSLTVAAITLTTPIECDLVSVHGTALTETAGQLAAGFKKLFDVAAPAFTLASVNQTGDSYAIVNSGTFGNAKLVRSTAPANTLDVSATGEAGLDFANIKDATGAHTLTNITVPTVTAMTNAPSDSTGVTEILTRVPDATAGGVGGLAIVGSEMVVPDTQKVDVNTINTEIVTATGAIQVYTDVGADGAPGGVAGLAIVGSEMTVPDNQKVDVNTIKTQTLTCAAGVTVLASVGTAATSTAQTGDTYDLWKVGGTLDVLLKDVPSTAEFNARTVVTADYFHVSNYTAPDNTAIAAIEVVTDKLGTMIESV